MRKWMRERIKRRKKAPDSQQPESPAPLQPAYFDAETPQAEPTPTPLPREKRQSPRTASGSQESPMESQPETNGENADTATVSNGDTPARKRRRRRGGRGRGQSSRRPANAEQGTDAVPAPSAVETELDASENAPIDSAAVEVGAVSADVEPVPVSSAVTQPKPAVTRAPRGVVVLAIGLPGSGKSSWFKRHNITPLSSDLLRSLLFDDASEQRFQDLIFSNLRSMLKARLIARRPMSYVDATNLTPHDRHGWIKLAKDYGYETQAVFFDVPLDVCLERNQRRNRVVSEEVMRRLSGKLRPPTFEEGFSKITVVRVKHKG
jgi:predicted kinase